MGEKKIDLKMRLGYSEEELRSQIQKLYGRKDFFYIIENKSLEARKKSNIHWVMRVAVFADKQSFKLASERETFEIKYRNYGKKVLVVGSGPAGLFCALVLQMAGFDTVIFEQGEDVDARGRGIASFEASGVFEPGANYCFGEGGAGTFSDGKLTSRSKRINQERDFILKAYVEAGASDEILYMTHPHLGSDNLKIIVKNLRQRYVGLGGEIVFNSQVLDVVVKDSKIVGAKSSSGDFSCDYIVFATGHSAYDTYRMLIGKGVAFQPKKFAIGARVEHPRVLINQAQWGVDSLPGIKAAEYRLTFNQDGLLPVYTFCMCPGGVVVPSAAYDGRNIVNGMSYYERDLKFSNAACVAGMDCSLIDGFENTPLNILSWVDDLEKKFYDYSGSFRAPSMRISDFIKKKESKSLSESSYPFELVPAPLFDMLPSFVAKSMAAGLANFSRKIQGFESGQIIGLESKTSAPIQVIRGESLAATGFDNLFVAGEASGLSGGIISSGADGVKIARNIIRLSE
ncbi:MAG: FAD-binding protein [Spirochaetales bacterium]|nr:FAD-binding protein [Spirochaetales bacterium]